TVAESVTYPLDIAKTRLQIQGERIQRQQKSSTKYSIAKRGFVATISGIVKEEGLTKLWQGVTPAIVRHFVYTGVRVITYETLRDKLFKHKSDGAFPLWEAMCSGMTSGAFAQFLASPTDLIKVQMQMEGRRRLEGLPPRVKFQIFPNFEYLLGCGIMLLMKNENHLSLERLRNSLHALKLLWSEGGVSRLWKGCIPNCQRAALVNMAGGRFYVDLATYDKVKHTILRRTNFQDNYVTHSVSSACSGLTAAVVSTPADVIKTRIMNQPTDVNGKGMLYKSSFDCLKKTIKNEGSFALYKGFVPIWARMAPWSLTFWISYEKIRGLTGVESF
uniref:Uncharacterized protein n=1 Tax=Romanomermis culicivorax TaxID=13658 RepID=A0A915KG43_ROMCU